MRLFTVTESSELLTTTSYQRLQLNVPLASGSYCHSTEQISLFLNDLTFLLSCNLDDLFAAVNVFNGSLL